MALSDTTNRQAYTCNGATVAFAFSHPFHAQADLVVLKVLISDGTETTLTITTDYTISGSTDAEGHYADGGTVTTVATFSSLYRLIIYRAPTLTQGVDLVENDPLPVNSGVESPMDRLTMISLRSNEIATRSMRQPDGDSAVIGALPAKVTRASLYLGFDAAGDPVALAAPANTTAVTAFMATVLDDATAAAALATLGALPLAGGTVTGDLTMSGASVVETEGAAVVAASSTNIWATDGNTVHVTGTTTITSFGTAPQAGAWMKVVFDDALTLTHGANLFINNAAGNITTAANDWAFVYADTTTQLDVLFFKANGQPNATVPGTLTAGTALSLTSLSVNQTFGPTAHGLGVRPKFFEFIITCTSTDAGYSANDVLDITSMIGDSPNNASLSILKDATNVTVTLTNGTVLTVPHFSTRAATALNGTKWTGTLTPYKLN